MGVLFYLAFLLVISLHKGKMPSRQRCQPGPVDRWADCMVDERNAAFPLIQVAVVGFLLCSLHVAGFSWLCTEPGCYM